MRCFFQAALIAVPWIGGGERDQMKEKQNNVIVSGSLRNCFQTGGGGREKEQGRDAKRHEIHHRSRWKTPPTAIMSPMSIITSVVWIICHEFLIGFSCVIKHYQLNLSKRQVSNAENGAYKHANTHLGKHYSPQCNNLSTTALPSWAESCRHAALSSPLPTEWQSHLRSFSLQPEDRLETGDHCGPAPAPHASTQLCTSYSHLLAPFIVRTHFSQYLTGLLFYSISKVDVIQCQ